MSSPVPRQSRKGSSPTNGELAHLLRLAAAGDADAFLRVYDATITMVYGYARLRYDDPAAVDGFACSLYLRVWRSAAAYPESGLSVRAWLLRHDDGAEATGSATTRRAS